MGNKRNRKQPKQAIPAVIEPDPPADGQSNPTSDDPEQPEQPAPKRRVTRPSSRALDAAAVTAEVANARRRVSKKKPTPPRRSIETTQDPPSSPPSNSESRPQRPTPAPLRRRRRGNEDPTFMRFKHDLRHKTTEWMEREWGDYFKEAANNRRVRQDREEEERARGEREYPEGTPSRGTSEIHSEEEEEWQEAEEFEISQEDFEFHLSVRIFVKGEGVWREDLGTKKRFEFDVWDLQEVVNTYLDTALGRDSQEITERACYIRCRFLPTRVKQLADFGTMSGIKRLMS